MKKLQKKLKIFMLIMLVVSAFASVTVRADYGSWIRGTAEYGAARESMSAVESGATEAAELVEDTEPNPIEKLFAMLVAGVAGSLTKALKAGGIDASTTGIIMGKFVNDVNYFVFDLSSHGSGTTTVSNPWGMIGAYLYVMFRSFALTLILLIVAFNIGRAIIFGGDKGLGEVKDNLYTMILFLLLLFIMPQVVDWVCEARDVAAIKAYNTVESLTHSGEGLRESISLEQEYYKMYSDEDGGTPSLLNASVYLAVCIIPFFYIVSYLGIALTETLLFGCFPLVLLLALTDRKAIHSWCVVVFTNLLVPMIDLILILLPSLIINLIDYDISHSGSDPVTAFKGSMLKAIVVVACFMLIMPTRNKLLSVLGNSMTGVKGGFGLGAVAGLGLAAAKAIKSRLGGGADGGKEGGSESEESSPENAEDSQKGLQDLQRELGDVSDGTSGDNNGSNDGNDDNDDSGDNGGDGTPGELKAIGDAENNGMESDNDEGGSFEDESLAGGDAAAQEVDALNGEGADGEAGEGGSDGEATAGMSDDMGQAATNATVNDMGGNDDMPPDYNEGDESDTPVNPKLAESELNERTLGSGDVPDADGDYEGDAPLPEGSELKANPAINEDIEGIGGAAAAESASAQADQAVRDESIGKDGFEKMKDMDGSLAKEIDEYSPKTKGDNPNFDRDLNMTRAANLQSMDNMRNRIDSIDKDNSAAQASIQADSNTLSQNMAKLDNLDNKEKAILDKYQNSPYASSEPTMSAQDEQALSNIRSERAQLQSSNEAARESIANAQNRIATNNVVKQGLQSEIGRRAAVEQSFGAMQERRGMNSQTFKTAKEFSNSLRRDSLIRQTANYKNFASAKYKGVLSPQERQQFQRQQNIRRTVATVAGGAAKVAGGAALATAGGVAMVALSVGGESGVAAGAAIAGYGVGTAVSGAGQVVSPVAVPVGKAIKEGVANTATLGIYRGGNAVASAGKKVFNAAKSAVAGGKKGSGDGEKKQHKQTRKSLAEGTATAKKDTNTNNTTKPAAAGANSGGKGKSEAEMFKEQLNAGKGDPTSREREKKAREEAQRNAQKFEGNSKDTKGAPSGTSSSTRNRRRQPRNTRPDWTGPPPRDDGNIQ